MKYKRGHFDNDLDFVDSWSHIGDSNEQIENKWLILSQIHIDNCYSDYYNN